MNILHNPFLLMGLGCVAVGLGFFAGFLYMVLLKHYKKKDMED